MADIFFAVEFTAARVPAYRDLACLEDPNPVDGDMFDAYRDGDKVVIEDLDRPEFLGGPIVLSCTNFLALINTWVEVLITFPRVVRFEYTGDRLDITIVER